MRTLSITTCFLLFLLDLGKAQDTGNSNNMFAFDFYKQVSASEKGNIFFSPFSLSASMGMVYAGSKNATENQISKVFHFPTNNDKFHSQQGVILKRLSTPDSVQLNIVNKLWAEKTYPFKKNYSKLMKKAYSASVEPMDFINNFEKSRLIINGNIYKSTNEKINDLLPSGSLNSLSRLVITNAIYFKGDWKIKFKKDRTNEANFYPTPQNPIKCMMMGVKSRFNYFEDSKIQAIELPYAGDKISMVIILPNVNQSIDEAARNFTADSLEKILSGFTNQSITISIPKFKLSTGYQLKQTLSSMGMPLPFSDNADFLGMSSKKDLKISDVFHKAFIDVNEEGTEAAAASGVVIAMKSVINDKFFIANRPFMFLIRDKVSGTILFMGRITDPTNRK